MRSSPSIVPADRLDRDICLVLEDFGAGAGCAWRETDEADTDMATVLQHLLSGQYTYPVRIVCFNPSQGWSRDATSEFADAVAQLAADTAPRSRLLCRPLLPPTPAGTSTQLALPLRGAMMIEEPPTKSASQIREGTWLI